MTAASSDRDPLLQPCAGNGVGPQTPRGVREVKDAQCLTVKPPRADPALRLVSCDLERSCKAALSILASAKGGELGNMILYDGDTMSWDGACPGNGGYP